MVYKPGEIKQQLREDRARGRKPPIATEEIQKLLEKKNLVKRLLKEKDISLFLKALSALGLKDGIPAYQLALEAWHEHWQTRAR